MKLLWLSEADGTALGGPSSREHVVPTGTMHIVLRLCDTSVRLWNERGEPLDIGRAVIGGVRSTYYVKDAVPARTIGAQLQAAAALPLVGVPASELADRHTRLDEVWGAAAVGLRCRLLEATSAEDALDRFEAALEARLPRVRGVHPAVAHALARFDALADVSEVVEDTGLSHRRLLTLFREAVGLAPKRYCRVLRLQLALPRVLAGDPLAEVAAFTGYSDQAHLTREFRELVGVSPGVYRSIAPARDHHVPIDLGKPSNAS